MIKNKYGYYTDEQFEEFREKLHSWVHWCFNYAEKNPVKLVPYMIKTQRKFQGLNDLLENDEKVVEIMVLLESAKLEFEENDGKTALFRKYILDAHEIIDRL